MTRINCVPVQELTNLHLLAEYRELPRVFKLAKPVKNAPSQYCLGKGHVTFFYDKLAYLVLRYNDLIDELELRGYNLNKELYTAILKSAEGLPSALFNNWEPTANALRKNRERIAERLKQIR